MIAECRWSWTTLLLLTLSCAVKQYEEKVCCCPIMSISDITTPFTTLLNVLKLIWFSQPALHMRNRKRILYRNKIHF